MINVSSHTAIKEELVSIAHSVPSTRSNRGCQVDPKKVKYVVINYHSPSTNNGLGRALPRVIESCLPQDTELWEAYLRSEQDAGIAKLTQSLLETLPGGLALTVEVNRGIVDANRIKIEMAIRNVLAQIGPETGYAKILLKAIHDDIANLIDLVLMDIPHNVEILFLHSMEPYSTPKQPPLSHDGIRAYLNAYKTRQFNDETRRPVDIVTGIKNGLEIADMKMNHRIYKLLRQMKKDVEYNNPYATKPDYPDCKRMTERPERVVVVDVRKTDLCLVNGADKSFDTTSPVVDFTKVLAITEMYAEALQSCKRC